MLPRPGESLPRPKPGTPSPVSATSGAGGAFSAALPAVKRPGSFLRVRHAEMGAFGGCRLRRKESAGRDPWPDSGTPASSPAVVDGVSAR